LDKTLFIPLKISLKWSLNRYGANVVISFVSYYQPHAGPATSLLTNCELDETYDRVTISAEAKFLTVSMATFHDNKQRYAAFLVSSYNYQSIAKHHYYRYTCKIIVDAGSSQRSKS